MDTRLQLLYIEDNPLDVELVKSTLEMEKIFCEITTVETPGNMVEALQSKQFDLILSDYSLPQFSGPDALRILHEQEFEIPFVLISGSIGEQHAVEILKSGATDYILKSNLRRLAPTIRRALSEYEERRKLKQATENLRKRETQLAEAQQLAHIGNWSLNLTTNRITLSEEMKNIFNIANSTSEITLDTYYSIIHPDDLNFVESQITASLREKSPLDIEHRITTAKGTIKYIHALGKIQPDNLGNPATLFGTAQDITDRKLAENKIQELATLIDKAQDAISVRSLDNKVMFWSKGAEKLYGWKKEEIIGEIAHKKLFKEEYLDEFTTAYKSVLEKGEWYGEFHHITRQGEDLIIRSHWTLVHDEQGNPKSILVISTDVTEKKSFEEQFLRAQRMESIGTLASGIAHDLNNILAPIILASDILQKRIGDKDAVALIERIQQNARRGAEVVKQVLSFARGAEGKLISIQVKHIIDEIVKIVKETFPKSIFIETDIPKNLSMISGDPTQIHQVLLNLCVNARDAMASGGKISISVSPVTLDESYCSMHVGAKAGEYILMKISDSGTGIPQNILDKIFDPFFTTKEIGKGTGLGLFTVHSIVKNHGGFIHVHSIPGTGTTFEIYLPALSEFQSEQLSIRESPLPKGNNELILIVDDEVGIREIAKEILSTHAYRVMTAGDGTEAVVIFAQHHQTIQAIVTDIRMPYMDGVAAIRAIKKINPTVKIIASSGSSDANLAENREVNSFLVKPYTASTLLTLLHDVLHSKTNLAPPQTVGLTA